MPSVKEDNIILPEDEHKSTFIFLHGLGGEGSVWCSRLKPIVPKHCKVICPTADTIVMTMYEGNEMRAWFDKLSVDRMNIHDKKNTEVTLKYLQDLVYKEVESGILLQNIIIGGFSQGAAIVYYSMLSFPFTIGYAVILGGWLPMHLEIMNNKQIFNKNTSTKIFIGHGLSDTRVLVQEANDSVSYIKQLGYTPRVNFYPELAHSVSKQEIKDIGEFLKDL